MPVTINGTAGVTFNNSSVSSVGGVGDGQTWQDVTASRALDTQYQNTTGRPIVVSVVCQGAFAENFAVSTSPTSGSGFVKTGQTDCGDYFSPSGNVPHNANVQGVIPVNWYYKAENIAGANCTLIYWAELR